MIIVSDSSPLISLSLISKLDLLTKIFSNIYIPAAVYNEITTPGKPYSKILSEFASGKTKSVKNKLSVSVLSKDLDNGEAEAIVLALENNIIRILIDEHKGRNIARANGLIPIGSLGILLRAKELKYIKEVKPYLDKLIQVKFRVSQSLYRKVLGYANELE
ncbi:MAG: hypothetical protein B6D61_05710 [Bacteroidetes bacterium 4484_249]|nr:MAG: hypothetical protein B6D61_05710 [Bacteroidetes bacterium 4484_249]